MFLVTFQNMCIRLVQALAGISLASSGLLVGPPRSGDLYDELQLSCDRRQGYKSDIYGVTSQVVNLPHGLHTQQTVAIVPGPGPPDEPVSGTLGGRV